MTEEQENGIYLVDIFHKNFTNDNGEKIDFVQIYFSNRDLQLIYKMKPYDTKDFLQNHFSEAQELIFKRVIIDTEIKVNNNGVAEAYIKKILPYTLENGDKVAD